MSSNVLIVDDEPNVTAALQRELFEEPYDLFTAAGGEEALELMRRVPFKVVVSDERMPGMAGSEFLARVRRLHPLTIRILLTGHATFEAAMHAVNEGEIYRFFTKPWDSAQLRFAIRSAIEKHDLEAENRRLLAQVRQRSLEIKVLERRYPGISRIERQRDGSLVIPDIPEEEIARMMHECAQETDECPAPAAPATVSPLPE